MAGPGDTFKTTITLLFSLNGSILIVGIGLIFEFTISDIFSLINCGLSTPITFPLSSTPKNSAPPKPLAKAETDFNQLLGFLISKSNLKS